MGTFPGCPMEPAVPANPLARAEALLRLGFAEPAELDDVLRVVAAFCGAPADVVLEAGPAAPGRRLLDPQGKVWGVLQAGGASPREGVEAAARLLEGMVARARARRERRGGDRGPVTSSFVPGLVHELRNASFGFSAILDAFEGRFRDRGDVLRYAGALRRNLEQLTGFIEELWAYGEPSSGPREPLALDRILREAAAQCEAQARQLGAGLRVAWEGAPLLVMADGAGLAVAFVALARWALGQGGGADVVLAAGAGAGGTAAGRVEGPGLQVAGLDLARAFEPFYFRAAGMGRLALPVARRILEAHGGTLTAGPGPGGEVSLAFTLPSLGCAP